MNMLLIMCKNLQSFVKLEHMIRQEMLGYSKFKRVQWFSFLKMTVLLMNKIQLLRIY